MAKTKFRKRETTIEAELYQPGMEDGFGYMKGGALLTCWEGGELCDPEVDMGPRVPFLRDGDSFQVIEPGSYIVTSPGGARYPMRADVFEAMYEAAN